MIVIGITGGIASGKSTIAQMIAEHGLVHVDADALVHQQMQTPHVFMAVGSRFPQVVRDGRIDRQLLGDVVVRDPEALKALERIVHPRVREAEEEAIQLAKNERRKGVILDVPLLFESGADILCDMVITASAPLELRKQRAMARPGMTEAKFARLIDRQWNDEQRNAKADIVIPTDKGIDFTRQQVQLFLREKGIA